MEKERFSPVYIGETDGEREIWSCLYWGKLMEKESFGPVYMGETDGEREFWPCFIWGKPMDKREFWPCLYWGNGYINGYFFKNVRPI